MHKDDDKQTLARAFAEFNAHSLALHQSYESLQGRLADMALALRESRAAEQRGQAENAALTDRLGALMEVLPAGVVEVDACGVVVAANAMAHTLFGESLTGQSWQSLVDQWRLDTTGNTLHRLGSRSYSLSRSRNRCDGTIYVFSDVSEAEATREREHRQNRLAMLGEMAARVAHQIRTPLATAMLYATNTNGSANARERIVARLRELEAMVDDMLLFARGTPPADEALDAGSLLRAVAQDARALLPAHVKLELVHSGLSVAVRGNRRALTGALHNLIANAAQHCDPESGRVCLSDSLDAHGRLSLNVADNGPGIDARLKQKIFEPFFTTRPDGTGLGLAVVRSVAQAHDGDVQCESGAEGSVFSLRLPIDWTTADQRGYAHA